MSEPALPSVHSQSHYSCAVVTAQSHAVQRHAPRCLQAMPATLAGEYLPQTLNGEAMGWQEAGHAGRHRVGGGEFGRRAVRSTSQGAAWPAPASPKPATSPCARPSLPQPHVPFPCHPSALAVLTVAVCMVHRVAAKRWSSFRRSAWAAAAPRLSFGGNSGRLRRSAGGRFAERRACVFVVCFPCMLHQNHKMGHVSQASTQLQYMKYGLHALE